MLMRCSDVLQYMAWRCIVAGYSRFTWKCNIAACGTWFDRARGTAGDSYMKYHFISFLFSFLIFLLDMMEPVAYIDYMFA